MSAPVQQRLTADPDVVRAGINALFGHVPDDVLGVSAAFNGTLTSNFYPVSPDGIEAAVRQIMTWDQRSPQGIYLQSTLLGERPPPGKRGGEAAVKTLTHFWVDGDYGTEGHKPGLDDLPHPPSAEAILQILRDSPLPTPTGYGRSGGGINGNWMLAEPYVITSDEDRAHIKALSVGWQKIAGAAAYRAGFTWDTEVGNIDRLMRSIGTVRRKVDCPERPTSFGSDDGGLYELSDIEKIVAEFLPDAEATLAQAAKEKQERRAKRLGYVVPPPRPPRSDRPAMHSGDGPLDVIADTMTFADVLLPHGWTFQGHHSDGREAWLRPTAGGDRASSPYSLLCNDYVAINWSDRADLPVGPQAPGYKLTVGKVFAHLNYNGNISEAATDIMRAAAGRATTGAAGTLPAAVLDEVKRRCLTGRDDTAELHALIAPDEPPIDWSDTQAGGDEEPNEAAVPLLGKLPASFYDRREVLKKIRQYAHSMCCSADVVLYATMARLAGMIDHNIKVDTGVKKPASLNLFVGVIDGSGSSKSTSNEASEDLLEAPDPAHREFLDGIPVGTGEGIAEALMGEVDTEDFTQLDKKDQPKIVRVRKQVRYNLYFYIDEGEALIRIGGRDGSSLWPSIRSAWQAGTLGQTNATAERRRFIKRGTYAMGMVAGFQPPNALVVLRDSITGTAQRFVWCLATDPDIPMEPVPTPDIDFGHPQNLPATIMTIPDEIKRKIRTELVLRNSGRLIVDPLDVHANLAKVKLAGLHALLDGSRTAITAQDWELAEEMWAVSCTLRTAILERASREEATAAQAKREERVEDAVQAHTAVARADARFEVRARWCVKKIREGVRREQLMEKASSKWRKEVPAGYELALSRGWLIEDDEGRVEVGEGTP